MVSSAQELVSWWLVWNKLGTSVVRVWGLDQHADEVSFRNVKVSEINQLISNTTSICFFAPWKNAGEHMQYVQ